MIVETVFQFAALKVQSCRGFYNGQQYRGSLSEIYDPEPHIIARVQVRGPTLSV